MTAKEFIKIMCREGIDCRTQMKFVNANECNNFKELCEKLKLEKGKWVAEYDKNLVPDTLASKDVVAISVPDDGNYYNPEANEDARMGAEYPAEVTLSKDIAYIYLYVIE